MVYTIGFNCINCKKIFSTNSNLKRHLTTCKGESLLPNECKFCHKIYSSSSAKCRHQKICKERPIDNIIINNIHNDNSITNNIDNTINKINKITINNFNNENIEYLNDITKKELIIKWLSGDMLNFLVEYTKEVYLNKEHPENSTIKDSETKGCLDVMIDGNFIPKHKITVYKQSLENIEPFIYKVAKDPDFPYNVKRNIHKHIIPFTNWENIGYRDSKDCDFVKLYNNKLISKMQNVYIEKLYKTIKNKKLIKN